MHYHPVRLEREPDVFTLIQRRKSGVLGCTRYSHPHLRICTSPGTGTHPPRSCALTAYSGCPPRSPSTREYWPVFISIFMAPFRGVGWFRRGDASWHDTGKKYQSCNSGTHGVRTTASRTRARRASCIHSGTGEEQALLLVRTAVSTHYCCCCSAVVSMCTRAYTFTTWYICDGKITTYNVHHIVCEQSVIEP